MSDFSSWTQCKVRKYHKCFHCHRWIVPGTIADKGAMVYAGQFQSWYQHLECTSAAQDYLEFTGDDEMGPLADEVSADSMQEWLLEYHPEVATYLHIKADLAKMSLDKAIRFTAAKHAMASTDRELSAHNGVPPEHLRGK